MIGATTALFMAFLGIVQNDIKRVVAYSTLSQLGYMTVALGVSAYSVAIFHLMTHAFFKALLFLGAGSVIIAMHHEQDLRRMGGLRRYMPITYVTAVIGSLALAGIPPFAGFYSKDAIIEAVGLSHVGGHRYAYFAVMAGVFVTAFYSFRMLFLAFHGEERFQPHAAPQGAADAHGEHAQGEHAHDASSAAGAEPDAHAHDAGPPRESPWVVTVPLILLAIPSVFAGWAYIAADALRRLVRQLDLRARAPRRARGARRRSGRASLRVRAARPREPHRSGSRSRASPPPSTCT